MKLKGTQILLKALEEEKVDIIFGYPGGAVLDIYDQECSILWVRNLL